MADFYQMDFMKSIVTLVKVDEMYNILRSVSHYWPRGEDGIRWSTFLVESALQCPYIYYVPPLLRSRLHFVRDTAAEKEFDITIKMEHVSSEIQENRNGQKKYFLTKTYKCYKADNFPWKNELAKSLSWHETNFCQVFISKILISEVHLE